MNAPTSSNQSLDLAALRSLVGDDPLVIRDLLVSYRAAVVAGLEHITEATKAVDGRALIRLSHKLKSSSRSVGAFALADAFAHLEECASAAQWSEVDAVSASLVPLWDAVAVEIQRAIGSINE